MHTPDIPRIAEGICRGEYSLLLGAGASMGSLAGNNEPLPSGPELRDRLVRDFSLPIEDRTISLARAYAAAKRIDSASLETYLRAHFTRCQPSWQHILPDFDWHRIWTLNIDDIVETAYGSKGIPLDRFNWTSGFRDSSRSQHQIVHLHGYVSEEPGDDTSVSELVFSVPQYAAAIQDMRTWHAVFRDEFTERPFIVLGASLIEEPDLQEALVGSAATTTRGFPSIVVLKEVTEFERAELAELGLVVVEADASSFMSSLHQAVKEYRDKVDDVYGVHVSADVARFLQQFADLRSYAPAPGEYSRHFYGGYEPHWKNILDDDDAIFDTTTLAFNTIYATTGLSSPQQRVHILTGYAGSGKSTGLLRIANQLIGEGLPTFQFRGDEKLDVSATLGWLERVPHTVLIVDGCADFADSIAALAEECEAAKIPLLLVATERSSRRTFLQQKIADRFLQLSRNYEYRFLTDADIDALIDKLSSRRRLGKITRRSRSEQRRYFKSFASRRLFEGMADLERGRGFRTRLEADYRQLTHAQLQRLYGAASIAYQDGYAIPIGAASRIAGLPVGELEALIVADDHDRMLIDRSGVRLPHRITASLIVETAMSIDDRFGAMQDVLTALAPHLDVPAIRRATRPFRLVRRLLDEENVMRLLGGDIGRQLYDSLQPTYDWNARYWDQRALFESALDDHERARSYAEHALQINRHPLSLNTLGTILGRIAVRDGDPEVLREAIRMLEDGRDYRQWDASEHPYVTFFTTIIRYGQGWGLESIPSQLRNASSSWFTSAKNAGVFASWEGEAQLQGFQREWLYLAVD